LLFELVLCLQIILYYVCMKIEGNYLDIGKIYISNIVKGL